MCSVTTHLLLQIPLDDDDDDDSDDGDNNDTDKRGGVAEQEGEEEGRGSGQAEAEQDNHESMVVGSHSLNAFLAGSMDDISDNLPSLDGSDMLSQESENSLSNNTESASGVDSEMVSQQSETALSDMHQELDTGPSGPEGEVMSQGQGGDEDYTQSDSHTDVKGHTLTAPSEL